jgi:hypothetical protein
VWQSQETVTLAAEDSNAVWKACCKKASSGNAYNFIQYQQCGKSMIHCHYNQQSRFCQEKVIGTNNVLRKHSFVFLTPAAQLSGTFQLSLAFQIAQNLGQKVSKTQELLEHLTYDLVAQAVTNWPGPGPRGASASQKSTQATGRAIQPQEGYRLQFHPLQTLSL